MLILIRHAFGETNKPFRSENINCMKRIYSKIEPEKLLHFVYTKKDLDSQEVRGYNISPEEMALQVRTIHSKNLDLFPGHNHPSQKRKTKRTQESLIIVEGSIEATYFDIDNTELGKIILKSGDCFITFEGGHKFQVLEQPTMMYEHKNGPYNGVKKDKKMIRGEQ